MLSMLPSGGVYRSNIDPVHFKGTEIAAKPLPTDGGQAGELPTAASPSPIKLVDWSSCGATGHEASKLC
jgi:hypothetical protein